MSSPQQKLTYPIIGLMIVLLTLTAEMLYLRVSSQIQRTFDSALLDKAMTLTTRVETRLPVSDTDTPDSAVLPGFNEGDGLPYHQLLEAGGDIIFKSASLGNAELPRLQTEPGEHRFTDMTLPDGRAGRLIAVSFAPGTGHGEGNETSIYATEIPQHISYTLVLARERESLDDTLFYLVNTIFGGTFMILLLATTLIWHLAEWRFETLRI